MKKGKEYEILIEQLYKKIDPESTIKRNDKIYGHNSKIEREIDLSIKRNIGAHQILMIVQAKDYKDKVDVNVIGEFQSVIQDVKANKGILISAKGFTPAALQLAQTHNIDALTGVDINNPKWTIDLKVPVILSTYSGGYKPEFLFVASQEYADFINNGNKPTAPPLEDWKLSENGGKTYKTISGIFHELLSDGILDGQCDGKEHQAIHKLELTLYIADGVTTPVRDFKFHFAINKAKYYKYFDVREFQGLINQSDFKISRANVKVESDEFAVSNYDVIKKKQIDLATWLPYDENTKLIHPYKIEVVSLSVGMPKKSNP